MCVVELWLAYSILNLWLSVGRIHTHHGGFHILISLFNMESSVIEYNLSSHYF